MGRREAFLAGERPDDVALYLADSAVDGDLSDVAERVEGGWLLVVDGANGRSVVQQVAGVDAMAFAQRAGDTRSTVARDLADGDCPADPAHRPDLVFAFVEAQNEEAGGLYADGPVVHAYARCGDCEELYSERWVAGD